MLKKLFTTVLFAIALTSCKPTSNTGADGYKFGEPQYEKQQVQVNIVTYKSQSDLLAAARQLGVDNPDVVAFSVLRPPFDVCTIHMVAPAVEYQPEFVGHEFVHCVYGQWHTNNDLRS